MLHELQGNGDEKKQDLYRVSRQRGPISYPLKIALPELGTPSLLDRVQSRPDVEGGLRLLRKRRMKERGIAVYIPPQAKTSFQAADDARFPLMERVIQFLESDEKVFLLLGDSGAGKSTFSRELEFELWQSYKNKTDRIPLHINLPAIGKPEHDMIAKQLRKAEFSEPQIREMKHYRKFILICDGYDENQQTHNLYMSNRLNQPGEWDAKMIISCRSEYLGSDYRDRFQPGDLNSHSDSSLFQEAVITPFTLDQVQAYIQQYVFLHQPLWHVEDYKQALELIPSLKELVKNPFLMALSLDVLPRMVDPGQHLSTTQVTRVGLYDHFVEQWLERGKKRIGEKELNPQSRAAFESLSDEGFMKNGIEYMKKLAVAIYKEQDGHPIVKYSRLVDEGSWKDAFFSRKDRSLLREACPLTRNGDQHRFIHRSLLEYGLACAVFDPQDRESAGSDVFLGRRGSVSSTLSFEIRGPAHENVPILGQEPDSNSPLVWRSFVNDYSLLQFLEERVQQEPVFKQQLLTYIEHSKKDKKWRIAAANAITILVRSGVQFNNADLKGIRIPGADLSHGSFDSADLQGADLRKVNFQGAWLRQTDLSKSQMTGAQFGELPYLTEDSDAVSCAYSPDGKLFAAGLANGNVSVYSTSKWERIRTLSGHGDGVQCVAFSPRSDQIASASQDMTVWLWDSGTGALQTTLTGHTDWVLAVVYSPEGDKIASGSDDDTVRLWNVATGDCIRTFYGHQDGVLSVAYSPQSKWIASSSADCTVRMWDVETGECTRILCGHGGWIWSVAVSPPGDKVASASRDNTIRIWDVETGACRRILRGHTSNVESISYSPKGDQLASGGEDATVRLWDVESGQCQQTLTGHRRNVLSVVFSPNGDQVASGSFDKTVRLRDVSAGSSRFGSSGHTLDVNSVKCSPKGDLIVSSSRDTTVRFWHVDTGASYRTISGHEYSVFYIAYSHQGDQIASAGAGKTVRLWDVEAGTGIHALNGHGGNIQCVAYSPQGGVVASASDDTTVKLWDMATGECLRTLEGHANGVMCIAYSPDGNMIASGSRDCTVRTWDAGTGECRQILVGHRGWARGITYSPQGNQLASAGYDKDIRLWDMGTGECRLTLTGHSDRIVSVAYSQRGDLLASGGRDETARVWDIATGQCRAEIRNFQGPIFSVAWSTTSDLDQLITGGEDGSVLKWEVVREEKSHRVRLLWSATNGSLTVIGASIQDVHGLTPLNKQLLKQRGANGEPEGSLRGSSKKLIAMSSVISRLKVSSDSTATDSSSAPSDPAQLPGRLE